MRDFYYWVVFRHPDCWASGPGVFVFRMCIVRHLPFLIFLASRPHLIRTDLVCGNLVTLPLPWVFLTRSLGASLTFPVLPPTSLLRSGYFYGGALDWRILWWYMSLLLGVYLLSLVCLLFSSLGWSSLPGGLYGLINHSVMVIFLCRKFFQTPILLLFDWPLFLAPLLLCINGGEDKNH